MSIGKYSHSKLISLIKKISERQNLEVQEQGQENIRINKSVITHDMGSDGGASSADTQNVRSGSVTITLNGTMANNASATLTVSSDKIRATDVIVAISSSVIDCLVHTVAAGSFKITAINKSGGTFANDSTHIINWVAL